MPCLHRANLLAVMIFVFAFCASAAEPDLEPSVPNIILFVSDDHGATDSGAYGDGFVRNRPQINY